MFPTAKTIKKAREEGRTCPQCQWIITKKDWKKGYRICRNCTDINKGVNVSSGHYPDQNESPDRTGEMP
jgi:hypothetical protein